MMKVNFLAQEYRREPMKTDELLGLCDPEGERCAYSTTEHREDKWCATIQNPNKKGLYFVAIDKNMDIRRDNGDLESLCDGMIYVPKTRELSFVELKDYRVGGAIAEAERQLMSTLRYFLYNHNYEDFHSRKAYICNPHHPNFAFSARERISEFRKKTHFALMPQATILL